MDTRGGIGVGYGQVRGHGLPAIQRRLSEGGGGLGLLGDDDDDDDGGRARGATGNAEYRSELLDVVAIAEEVLELELEEADRVAVPFDDGGAAATAVWVDLLELLVLDLVEDVVVVVVAEEATDMVKVEVVVCGGPVGIAMGCGVATSGSRLRWSSRTHRESCTLEYLTMNGWFLSTAADGR